MTTLEEAWTWYGSTRDQLQLIRRLGKRYWDVLPWDSGLGKDNRLHDLNGSEVAAGAQLSLSYLDDLAVVVLFSVFESAVRQQVIEEMEKEVKAITHRSLRFAAEEAQERVREGSFFHVLEPFKPDHADLVEEVHQVRRYRNWVAHGRKGRRPNSVSPPMAYDRLQRFLDVLFRPGPQKSA